MCYRDLKVVKICFHCGEEKLILKRDDFCSECCTLLTSETLPELLKEAS